MSDQETTYQQIEEFLKGRLSVDASESFRKQMENDASLETKVNTHKLANDFIKKNTLTGIREQVALENTLAEKRAVYRKITIATISVVVLGLISFWMFNKGNHPTNALPKTTNLAKSETKIIPSGTEEQSENKPSELQSEQIHKVVPKEKSETNRPLAKKESSASIEVIVPENPIPTEQKVENDKVVVKPVTPTIQQKTVEAKPNKCLEINLSAHITAMPACVGEQNGSIHVSGFKGGTAPYKYEVLEENRQKLSYSHLAKGTYSVVVQDGTGCSKTIENVQIIEKECETEYSFNPYLGDTWQIPSYESDGTLTIYDETGNVYFRAEIPASEKSTWSGYSSKGELRIGYFPFVIKYKNGHTKHGAVSLGK